MNSHSTQAGKLTARELCQLGVFAALMVATQAALAALPNIHLVAVLVILAALLYGWKSLYAIFLFVGAEALIYGFSIWVLSYLYLWPGLAAAAILLRKNRSRLFWACVAGLHGLTFGAQCAIPYWVTGGFAAGFSYWVAGIPFDLIHCASNFAMTFFLLMPLKKLCEKLM